MPRSPSRDLSDRFEGNRGYFHRAAGIARAKYVLSLFALVLALGWAVAEMVFPSRAKTAHTHGPVAHAHARWEDDCAACHRTHCVSEIGPGSLFRARDRWHDLSCDRCHAGPRHVDTLTGVGQAFHDRCSNCHHEHGGRITSLIRISDDHCTRCHANLAAHHVIGTPTRAEMITSFTGDHPEFRPLTKQPERTLKFSHTLHMAPGQALIVGGKTMTLGKLKELTRLSDPQAVDRYRGMASRDDAPISLNCASCHKLDAEMGTDGFEGARASLAKMGEPTRSLLPARAAGAHFLPVNFEAHCRACHPLEAPAGASAGSVIGGFPVPHRKQGAELKRELNAGYLNRLLEAEHPALAPELKPGGKLDKSETIAAAKRTLSSETDRLVADAQRILGSAAAGCAKCHDVIEGQVARVPDRTVWLPGAYFDHAQHKHTTCSTCHPGTGKPVPTGPLDEKEPVQILGIDSCRACHSPSGTKVILPADGAQVVGGGARHACVDCHRYHNADHGLQGRGAAVRWPKSKLDLADFLRGAK